MALTLVSAVLSPILNKLSDDALKKFALSQNIYSELDKLQNTLKYIENLLNDASRRETNEESVRLWLNNLQHLAYDIDDMLDDVATEAMGRELDRESEDFITKVRNLILTCCTKLSLSQRLHRKLDSITIRLQDLVKEISFIGLVVKDEKQKSNNRGNETCLPEPYVVGREGEKQNLINKLLGGESSKENFSIIPIVGMGGVGKTTLARLLYNDTRVKNHFQLQAWVCVSDFDIVKISNAIFGCVTTEKKEFKDLNQIQMALTEKVKDKRLLLVVDDVWHENCNDWENFVRPFRSCAPGSKIIMTTRNDQFLKKIGIDHLDLLKSLSDTNALSLLALHALGVDNFDSHPTLRSKGKGIVRKCGGLPLALKAIGRLLRTKQTDEEDWDEVLKSEIWDLENSSEIVPALRLSYHDLSSHLKQLFAYCSLFPKDFLFDKDELVLLWMAEGYLLNPSLTNNKAPEDLGNEYFEKLLSRSFFQYAPNYKSFYVMHDLMNDLATFVAGDMFLRFEQQTKTTVVEKTLAKYRHMSFVREEYVSYQKFEAFESARSLRTLLAVPFGEEQSRDQFYLSNKFLVNLIPQLPLLRVLSLRRFGIREVPDLIGNLKHLRYLNLSQSDIEELPENIGNLYNLQTLILFGCKRLKKLPKSFVKLKLLRHFDIRDTPFLNMLPVGIGELRSLRTLTKIIIGGDEDGFAITKLKVLTNLCGEISIEGLHNVQSATHAREANLSLRRLTKLGLNWGNGLEGGTLEKEVFNELKPHADMMNELKVEFYEGIEFPVWVGDPCFQKMVSVSIRGCRKCKFLPPLGQLPFLKNLFIEGMDEVKVIGSEFIGTSNGVAFNSLEILSFENMSGWEEWSTNTEVLKKVFPCLGELSIKKCPKLKEVALNALPSLRGLDIDECGNGVLRSLVRSASSIKKLKISSISELTDETWRGALTSLRAVEEVEIKDCNDIRYLWESEAHASIVLGNIKKMYVKSCENLVSLGEKEDDEDSKLLLSSLRALEVNRCKSMERCILNSNSIERLLIDDCESLTRVSFIGQKLKSLFIGGCKKLIMENMINTSMPMLEDVSISSCTDLKSQLIQLFSNSIHLTSMSIHHCPSIESFPDIQLPNLAHLNIEGCQNLKSFPDIQFTNLTSLSIEDCKNLKSFPDLQLMNLTLLTNLEIVDCQSIDVASYPGGNWPPNLVSLVIGGLKKPISEWGSQNFPTSLVHLTLCNEPHVINFSQLSHLLPSSLERLAICGFDKLESLSVGLQHLTSLRRIWIWICPELKDLPEALLPSLFDLLIIGCPILTRRCNGRGSRYWPLVSHIPIINSDLSELVKRMHQRDIALLVIQYFFKLKVLGSNPSHSEVGVRGFLLGWLWWLMGGQGN